MIGDEVLVYFEIRTSDTLLFTTPQKNGLPIILVNPALNKTKKTGPIADVLPLLGEGDSAIVRMPVTDEMRTTPGLETADELFYHVAVRKINRAGSEEFGKAASSASDESTSAETLASLPNLRTKLKASGKGINELRELSNFIGQVKTAHSDLRKTENGLVYRILAPGQGKTINAKEEIEVHYLGALADGTIFAETYSTDRPFSFVYQEGRVIKGWDEAMSLVRVGGSLLLAVPPELAYGKIGKTPYISSDQTLYYYLQLVE
jgi:FKBP-type peptidyl-prolyl cis-trans isomerase